MKYRGSYMNYIRDFKGKGGWRDTNNNIAYIQYNNYAYLEGHQKVSNT